MSRNSTNSTRLHKSEYSEPSTRILRECSCFDSKRHSRGNSHMSDCNNTRNTTGGIPRSCLKKTPVIPTISRQEQMDQTAATSSEQITDRGGRTWFQVLIESPKKAKPERILHTNRNNKFDIPSKYADSVYAASIVPAKENIHPGSKTIRRINLLLDVIYDKINETSDRNYLQILADIHNMMEDRNGGGNYMDPGSMNYSHYKRSGPITDDDKYHLRKPRIHKLKTSEKSDESSEITLKALVKLLENMKTVNEKAEDQKELLENLTLVVNQLREENKMLNKMKEIRIELESKLATVSTDYQHVKEKLALSEREREKTRRLLEARDKEVDFLKNHLSSLKLEIAGKIHRGLGADFDDPSVELKYLNDTIATLPSHQESFNMLIRPASSSPTEEILQRNQPTMEPMQGSGTGILQRNQLTMERIQGSGTGLSGQVTERKRSLKKGTTDHGTFQDVLLKLKDDVKKYTEKLTEDLEAELQMNDVSWNLSDVTFRGSP